MKVVVVMHTQVTSTHSVTCPHFGYSVDASPARPESYVFRKARMKDGRGEGRIMTENMKGVVSEKEELGKETRI